MNSTHYLKCKGTDVCVHREFSTDKRVGWDSVAGSVHRACQPHSLTLKSVHPRVPVNKRQSQQDTLAEFIFRVPYSLGLQTFTLQREKRFNSTQHSNTEGKKRPRCKTVYQLFKPLSRP